MLVKRNPRVLSSTLPDGNAALLVVETGRYVTFDETATAIWERTKEPIAFGDLVASLLEEYEVARDVLELDVRTTLETLAEKRVLCLAE